MSAMASQITSLTIVYSNIYLGTDQRKQQSSTSLACVWGIHRGPVNSLHKWAVTRKMIPFDVIMVHRWAQVLKRPAQLSQDCIMEKKRSNFMPLSQFNVDSTRIELPQWTLRYIDFI